MNKKFIIKYKCAPENSKYWKCDWLYCAAGMGLAGNGFCSFRGRWDKKDCLYFISAEDFDKRRKAYKAWEKNIKKEVW